MSDLIFLYFFIVIGVAVFFIIRDTELQSSDSQTKDPSSKSIIEDFNTSRNHKKSTTTSRKKTIDSENYVPQLNGQINYRVDEKKLPIEIDPEVQTELIKYNVKSKLKSSTKKLINDLKPVKKLVKKSKTMVSRGNSTHTKKTKKNINELSTSIDIKFIEDTHEYYVNGKKVISVSELINTYASDLNIFNDYANVPDHVLRRAALKGEALHKEIEDFEKTGYESESVEFYNYKKIKQKLKFNVKHSEIMVAIKNSSGEFVAAGRLDMLVSFGSKVGIIDIKRTWKFYRDKVTAQVNLYRLGLLHTYGIKADELRCIRLREAVAENYIIKSDEKNIMRVLDSI